MTDSIFLPPAGTALFVLGGLRDEMFKENAWFREARRRNWILVGLNDIPAPDGPWLGSATPGSPTGCRTIPHDHPRRFDVYGDAAGIYLSSTIDLILHSQGVKRIIVAGSPCDEFVRNVGAFAALEGYETVWLTRSSDLSEEHFEEETADMLVLPDLAARVSPENAALVLIDFQNDFCAAEGATGRTGQPMAMIGEAVAHARTLLHAAREAGLLVVHVGAEYGAPFRSVASPYRYPTGGGREPAVWTASAADLSDTGRFASNSVEVCLPGSWGAQFVDELKPLPGEVVINKHRFGAFAGTGLDRLLRARGISSLIIAGVTTNCCVETTSREALMRNFHVVIAEDCVGVKDHLVDLHKATLESLGLYFGLVRSSDGIMLAWQDEKRTAS